MPSLTETAEHWEVDLRGRTVEMLTIDHRLTFHLHGDASYEGSIILARPFGMSIAGRDAIMLDPEKTTTLTPALECFGKTVAAVSVSRHEGALTLAFTDGTVIGCIADPQYEAWEVNTPGVKIIATPGGGEPTLFA